MLCKNTNFTVGNTQKVGIERVLANISRSRYVVMATQTITNPPNIAQLGASPTSPPSYIRVRAIV